MSAIPADFHADANYDEAKVASYTLPDPLVHSDGSPVGSARSWLDRRRQEIVDLFRRHVFGRSPGAPADTRATVVAEDANALNGLAIRREVTIVFGRDAPALNLLLYLPKTGGRSRLILGPNFLGNHTVHPDPAIRLPQISFVAGMDVTLPEGRATDASRGLHAERWPIERIIERGYALATFFYGDLYPDRSDGRALSVQPLFDADSGAHYDWGAIATWAWGVSRALDVLQSMAEIDVRRVAVIGHSRHGKAALWAGALDERFALVIANNSGKGGASLMRRSFGETVRHLVTRYPHWFAAQYATYAGREWELPVDQHMLIALLAPRPVYIASAAEDLWADPRGEFLAALAASPVYRLLGTNGLAVHAMPRPENPIMSTIGYHIRQGGHGVTAYDWERFLDFADRHLA